MRIFIIVTLLQFGICYCFGELWIIQKCSTNAAMHSSSIISPRALDNLVGFLFKDMGSRKVERDFYGISTENALLARAVGIDSLSR